MAGLLKTETVKGTTRFCGREGGWKGFLSSVMLSCLSLFPSLEVLFYFCVNPHSLPLKRRRTRRWQTRNLKIGRRTLFPSLPSKIDCGHVYAGSCKCDRLGSRSIDFGFCLFIAADFIWFLGFIYSSRKCFGWALVGELDQGVKGTGNNVSDAWSTPRPRTRFFLSVGWENKGPVLRDVRSLKAPLDLAWPFLQPKQDREWERRREGGRERGKVGRCRVTLISALTSNLDAVICNNPLSRCS